MTGKRRLELCLLRPSATLREAMVSLTESMTGIVLVVNGDRKLLGTCTDGDIRKAILRGATLESPIEVCMVTHYISVGPQASRVELLDLMRARQIHQIPILDGNGQILGLHLLREIIGEVERPNWAVLMAGGKGTRLQPLTERIPKPMLLVVGRPILERLVLHLVGFGIRRIFLAVHHLRHVIEDHFGDGSGFGCRIEYLREETPLGTGGALSLLPECPQNPLLVMNGDLVTNVDVDGLLRFHEEGGYTATVGVREYIHTVPFGVLEVEGPRVRAIAEKPVHSWLANAGTYVLNASLLDRMPRRQEIHLPTLIEDAVASGESVGAYRITEDWEDVGRPSDLKRARGQDVDR